MKDFKGELFLKDMANRMAFAMDELEVVERLRINNINGEAGLHTTMHFHLHD